MGPEGIKSKYPGSLMPFPLVCVKLGFKSTFSIVCQ